LRWKRELDRLTTAREQRLGELRAGHRAEMAAFREKYDREESFRKYTKVNGDVLQLRAKEHSLVLCNRFQEARALAREAARAENAQAEVKQRMAEEEVMRKQGRILERQEKEIGLTLEHYEKMITQAQGLMESEMRMLKKRLSAGREMKKQIGTPIIVVPGGNGRSPRASSEYMEFRAFCPTRKLALQPLTGLGVKCGAGNRITGDERGNQRKISD
jgi:hypothetical protein